jgi:hypothetical protein
MIQEISAEVGNGRVGTCGRRIHDIKVGKREGAFMTSKWERGKERS